MPEQEPVQTQATQSTSTSNPAVANTPEKILMLLIGVFAFAVAGLILLSVLSGKTEAGMSKVGELAGLALAGILALMQAKK